jgi:cytoskeleton protein RodZ
MTPPTKATPREYGEALRRAREAGGSSLDTIAARTKISVRLLTAIEEGEFGRLPNHTFARMFVRQYVEMIGAPPGEWLEGFEAAWRQFADSSQPMPVGLPIRARSRRVGPWAVGLAVVAVAGAAVFLVESRREPAVAVSAAPTPAQESTSPAEPSRPAPEATPPPSEAKASTGSTAAAAVEPQRAPTAVVPAAATTLVVSAPRGPCWVEVRVAGEIAASRLLAAGAVWQVSAAGRPIDLVLGDAGAASVAYMGELHDPAGRPGQVARLHLAGSSSPSVTR